VNSAADGDHRAKRHGKIDSVAIFREGQLPAGGTDLGGR
jgi:hypothetical protein